MKLIFTEVRESLTKKKGFSILLIAQIVLFFLLASIMFLQNVTINTTSSSFLKQFDGKNIYRLSDSLIGEKEDLFNSDPENIEDLKVFVKELKTDPNYIYFNTTVQPVNIATSDFKGSNELLYGYETGEELPPYEDLNGNGMLESVKSIQISKNAIDNFNVKVKIGRLFTEQDYLYQDDMKLPLLLGSEYEGLYEIGNNFTVNYLNRPFEGEVVGILKENTNFPVNGEVEFYVDRYIMIPNLSVESFPKNEEDITFQRMLYLQKINGQIITEKNDLQVKTFVNEASKKAGFFETSIIGADNLGLNAMFSLIKLNKKLITSLTIILLVFCIFTISISFIMKLTTNLKNYSIHLISGASVKDVLIYMSIELSILISCSFLIIILIQLFALGILPISYYIFLLIIGLVVGILGMLPVQYKLKNTHISVMLKGKE